MLLLSLNHLLDLVMVGVGLGSLPLSEDGVLDIFDLLLSLLGCYLAPHLYLLNFSFGLSLDTCLFPDRFRLLLLDFLFLSGDLQLRLLRLNVLVVLHQILGDVRLGDSDGNDLDTRSPVVAVFLQLVLKLLVQVVELVNEHLLQSGLGAELVNFVVDLIEYPGLVVIHCVVFHCLISVFLSEPVDNFNLVEPNEDSSLSSTGDVVNLISLDSHLNRLV